MFGKLFGLVTCVSMLLIAGSAHAQPTLIAPGISLVTSAPAPASAVSQAITYDGCFQLQAPTFNTQSGYVDTYKSTEIVGQLRVHNLVPSIPVTAVVSVNYALGGWHSRYDFDNTIQAGIEYPLSKSTTFFSLWDREPALGFDRVWVGLRCGFKGGL